LVGVFLVFQDQAGIDFPGQLEGLVKAQRAVDLGDSLAEVEEPGHGWYLSSTF
jgi:hypothetical protein